jgi:hypothetical protein
MRGLNVAPGQKLNSLSNSLPFLCTASVLFLLTLAGMNSSLAQDNPPATGDAAVPAVQPAPGSEGAAVNAAQAGKTPEEIAREQAEDAAREKSIAEFTQKMKDSNYPALFEKAAKEFDVPVDILQGISFAETRWEHLQWPAGETVSPENGMPRPYGIMSLWDNEYFGHSLLDAAKLIGKDPEELKSDPLQNMRGAAALLKKIYNETPKPADAQGDEIESWRKAIVKYCGIPQAELSEQHGLEVYEHMNEGYHQYGIEWPKHPVNLEPMRAEVAKIKAEARAKTEAQEKAEQEKEAALAQAKGVSGKPTTKSATSASSTDPTPAVATAVTPAQQNQRWLLIGVIIALVVIAGLYVMTRKPADSARKK